MTQHSGQIQVKDIDHLGIVAGMIDQMGWVDAVNEIVGVHSLEQVSTGQLLKATQLVPKSFLIRSQNQLPLPTATQETIDLTSNNSLIMGLCLLVYSLAQRQLRQALQQAGEGIKNQVGKLTSRPTLRPCIPEFSVGASTDCRWCRADYQSDTGTTENPPLFGNRS
ncbi:MAG TPA: hypothetical protein DCP31_38090 [Cyanobacteria bacterium UBA8543]|nr:hypothetical protein [Cyanobacteria bacterium UBA8543]